jgi:glycerophosphoryl diester phosphodiesterase
LTSVFLDSPTPIAFAHRGGSVANENGLAAFKAAQQLGYRYVETDVRTTSDGVPLIFHDADMLRMTGHSAKLSELTAAQVGKLTLSGGEPPPTLEQTLKRFPTLRFNIDLKDDAAVQPTVEVLRSTGAVNRVCVISFSERRVEAVRRMLGREVCTGLGVAGALRAIATAGLQRFDGTHGATTLQLPLCWHGVPVVTRRLVKRAHRAQLAVHVWTLNDRRSMERALDMGVDGIMTDDLRLLKEMLVAHNLWQMA